MDVTKIVITGGPCAGKSTAMSRIQETFAKMQYAVVFVAETATELITGGISSKTCQTNAQFQENLLRLQLQKEAVFERAARTLKADKVLIVCDRGALDNKAYMTKEEFDAAVSAVGSSEVELRDGYDAVFHLVTAAKGAEEHYTKENNTARTETPEEAREIDEKLIAAWTGHPHLRVIDNASDFNDKIRRLIKEIATFLGEPEPLEIERKYLIEYPDTAYLESLPCCERVEIIQTYLNSADGDEVRVRQRGADGNYIYFETIKTKGAGIKRVEKERRLSQAEYLRRLMDADTTKRQIRKTRYCLTYESQYFEIDVYPFWDDKAIMEIELNDENAAIVFPPEIRVIKEVTDDVSYKNASLARV